MTSEHLLVLEPSDIRCLRIECLKCHVVMSFRLDQTIRIPNDCPACGDDWFHGFAQEGVMAFNQLTNGLKEWLRMHQKLQPGIRVGFEFSDPNYVTPRR